jgi:hypothetical protein
LAQSAEQVGAGQEGESMAMSRAGAQANGMAAARAEARGDSQYADSCFRAVVREATRLSQRGQREQAEALCEAFERGYGEGV